MVISTKMPKELLEFDMTKPPGASWGIRICGGVDRGKVLTIEKVQYKNFTCLSRLALFIASLDTKTSRKMSHFSSNQTSLEQHFRSLSKRERKKTFEYAVFIVFKRFIIW